MAETTLSVSRTSDRDIKIRGIQLLLDGAPIGDLSFGRCLELEVNPGPHILVATNKLKTARIEFVAVRGQMSSFQVAGIPLGGIWMLMSILGTVAYRVTLEPAA